VVDDGGALLAAIEGLRSDMREDIGGLRDDLRDVETRMVRQVSEYTMAHGAEHRENYRIRDEAHAKFNDFIANAELGAARRDGALGVVRFMFELVSRHSGALVKVVVSIAAAALVVGGNVHISIQ
jgi:hypothetical protein